MIRRAGLSVVVPVALFTLSLTAMGQGRPPLPLGPGVPENQFASITVTVADESGTALSEEAVVRLSSPNNQTNLWRTTEEHSQVVFDDLMPAADYDVEVSAAGYDTVTQRVHVMFAREHYGALVRLRRHDASGAAPEVPPGQLLVGKARTEAQKGISDLSAGKLKDAEKHIEKAYKIAPGNADLNYLMAVVCSKTNRTGEVEGYLNKAVTINPKHVRALTMLGELRLWKKDYKNAITPLEQTVAADPGFWTAHWLLAQAYFKNGEFEKSREQAELAIRKGKGAAVAAELVLGQALANLGRNKEAVEALQTYLQEDPKSPLAEPVRKLIAQLQAPEPKYQEVSALPLPAAPPAALPVSAPEAGLSIPTWHPAGVDDEKLTLAAGVVCPATEVIHGATRNAEQLVDNVGRFEATEQVLDEELDSSGKPKSAAKRKFDYIASISENKGAGLAVNESRRSLADDKDFSNHIATSGLAALALVFHPAFIADYRMTCEGLSEWKGRATWLVYFRQRPDKPARFLTYAFTNAEYWVALKGRAWISADKFQIVHLEADLLNPVPAIQLRQQHQSVDYGPVEFKTGKTQLWLPKSAEIYIDFRRHEYYRRHSFENYKLFAVGASQKIGEPKIPDATGIPQQ
ncbi:MAG TPA: tetratricopeptide repeat protein [Candidatus Acidoferrales bacterium]|nr:tetratricopeptide repeat protein [Candidatus Acidoferrales bacterium]